MASPAGSTPTGSVLYEREDLLRNSTDESVPWVVQKYGGTSVGKSLDSICAIVASYIPNSRVALVCSARSSHTKALGTTNLLLQASREALQPPVGATPRTPGGHGSSSSSSGPGAAANGLSSGAQTPYFPKRVGSGFFGGSALSGGSFTALEGNGSGRGRDGRENGAASPGAGVASGSASASLISSIASLKDLDIASPASGGRTASPSPFTPTGRRSPTGPLSPALPGPSNVNGSSFQQEQQPQQAPVGLHATVDTLKKGHLDAARATVREGELRDELEDEIERDCESLRGFLQAAQIIDEISPRSQDSIVGTGERLACKIVAAALRDRGIDSELVVLDSIVDASMSSISDAALTATGDQGVAQLSQEFYDQLSIRLGERIRECGDRVPVITGYFGPVPGSLLAQIGRGYTDLCAALCAVGLQARELQVWKEVDGIFTADPRKVTNARLVPIITPDEAAELTYYGSEVIHPFTMEQVIRASIPIRIKNVENPSGGGTVIYPEAERAVGDDVVGEGQGAKRPAGVDVDVQLDEDEERAKMAGRMPTAVTIKDSIIVLNIHSNRKTISHGFLARIFGTLDRAGVVVDLISTSEVHVSMAMQSFDQRKRLDRIVKDLGQIGDVTVSHDMAILSLVGRNMRHAIGSAGAMFTSLARAMINIEMISQGASEINISCVIENKDAIKALNVIHESCLTIPPSPARYLKPLA